MAVLETRQLLTVAQAAEHYQCSQQSIRAYCRDGVIPAVRVGGMWRVSPHVLHDDDALIIRKGSK
jgi:excisionase family DNA binding protein